MIVTPRDSNYGAVARLFDRARVSRLAPYPPATDGLGQHWERFENTEGEICFRAAGALSSFEMNYGQVSTERNILSTPEPQVISADNPLLGDTELIPQIKKSPKVK